VSAVYFYNVFNFRTDKIKILPFSLPPPPNGSTALVGLGLHHEFPRTHAFTRAHSSGRMIGSSQTLLTTYNTHKRQASTPWRDSNLQSQQTSASDRVSTGFSRYKYGQLKHGTEVDAASQCHRKDTLDSGNPSEVNKEQVTPAGTCGPKFTSNHKTTTISNM